MVHHGVNKVSCPCPGSLLCCCPACLMEWNLDQRFGVSEEGEIFVCFSVYCSSEAEQTKGGNHERLLQRNWNYLFDHAMQNDIWFVCNWNTVDWLKCLMFVTEGTGSARTAPYFGTRDSNSNMRIFRAMDEWPSISAIFGQAICTFVTYKSSHVSGPIFLIFFRSQDLEVDLAADLPEVGNCGWVKRQHSY